MTEAPASSGHVLGDDTRSTIEHYLAELNAGDPDAIAGCVTDDFHNDHIAAIGTSVRGRAAYRERLPEFLARFRGLRYEAEDVVVEGDRAAVPYRMSCTWVDEDGGEHAVHLRGLFWFRVRGGAICHRVDYWDSAEFERQVSGGSR